MLAILVAASLAADPVSISASPVAPEPEKSVAVWISPFGALGGTLLSMGGMGGSTLYLPMGATFAVDDRWDLNTELALGVSPDQPQNRISANSGSTPFTV